MRERRVGSTKEDKEIEIGTEDEQGGEKEKEKDEKEEEGEWRNEKEGILEAIRLRSQTPGPCYFQAADACWSFKV